MKVEICVTFNTGEIAEDFDVKSNFVEFKAPKLRFQFYNSLPISKYDMPLSLKLHQRRKMST